MTSFTNKFFYFAIFREGTINPRFLRVLGTKDFLPAAYFLKLTKNHFPPVEKYFFGILSFKPVEMVWLILGPKLQNCFSFH
jgi:hypothetical protein